MSCPCPTCGQPLPQIGVFFEPEAGIVVANGRFASLTQQQAVIFERLHRDEHHVTSKQQLMDALYGLLADEEPAEKIVDVFVFQLRRKLKGLGLEIETVWGVGYRLKGKQE